MSEESDIESDTTASIFDVESEQDELLSTIKNDLMDEDNQFIYDEVFNKLICIGSNLDDIPFNIIQEYSLKTKALVLSGNNFRSLSCLENFPNLEELIIDDNQLDDAHTYFPKLSKLHTLMINKNQFQDIFQLADNLRYAFPELAYLSLLGNEVCPYGILSTNQKSEDLNMFAQNRLEEEYRRYRHLLIYRIPTLKFLDIAEINGNERHIATQLGDILYSIAEAKRKVTKPAKKNYKEQLL